MLVENQALHPGTGRGVRDRLLEVATGLFAQKGYAGTFVREIVQMAGVTKPVLYYYFESKEGLFHAILNRAAREQERILEEVLQSPGSVLERLTHLYRHLYHGLIEHQSLFQMIHNLLFSPRQGAPKHDLDRFRERMVETIRVIYQQGAARGEVVKADPRDVAALVLSLLEFCFHMDCLHPETRDPDRPQRLLRMAFQGLARRPENRRTP